MADLTDDEELELLELENANALAARSSSEQPTPPPADEPAAEPERGALSRAWETVNRPVPYVGDAVEALRTGIPEATAEEAGVSSAGAGPLGPLVRGIGVTEGMVVGMTGELLPKSYFDWATMAAAGPVGKGLGAIGSKMLPPIEQRAPNAVRAVKAALSADILPTIPQITQSQAWAQTEEVMARLPWFGRRIKAMRQAQENAYQALRTSAVKSAGPAAAGSEIGETTRQAVFGEVEQMAGARERDLARLHAGLLKKGGDPTTAEAAARALDEIRVAKTEEARKTAGKLYDEVAELITPEVDKVTDQNLRGAAEKVLSRFERLPSATLDSRARKLLEDIKSGPGNNIIENAPDPMTKLDALTMGGLADQEAVKKITERQAYTFQEMQTLRSTLNDLIQQERLKVPPGQMTPEGRIYKDLKTALDSDIESFGNSLTGDLRDKFQVATAYYRDHYKAIFANPTLKNLAQLAKEKPGAVFDSLIARGNVVDIQRLKRAVGEQGFAPMRRLTIERLVTKDGKILGGPEITKNLASYGDEALKEILTPEQLAEVSRYRQTRELPRFIETEMEKKLRGLIFERDGIFRAPEEVVSRVINGDTATLKAVKRIVGQKGTDQYRRRIIEDILGEASDPTMLPGQVQNRTALKIGKALKEYDPSFLREAFSEKELKEIERIDDIKALLESQPRLNANPGTAPAALSQLATAATGGLLFTHPVSGVSTLLGAEVVSRLYVSEAGRRLLMEGLDPKLVKNLPLYTRLATAAANAQRDNAREAQINRGVQIK